jgi:hypothetical protein
MPCYSGSKELRIIVKTGFELCDILMKEHEVTCKCRLFCQCDIPNFLKPGLYINKVL